MSTSFANIKTHTELRFKIMQLNSLRAEQELELKKDIATLYQSMHPLNLLRNTISEFASDKQVQSDVAKIGINWASDFLIGKLLGSNTSIKKYLSSMVLQKAADYMINNHPGKIAWGVEKISNLFQFSSTNKKDKSGVEHE